MLVDGLSHGLRLARGSSVLATHRPLKLGELLPVLHHLRHEVGLRKIRRPGDGLPVDSTQTLGQPERQPFEPPRLVQQCPEPLQPHDAPEVGHLVRQSGSRVLLPVECSVVQTGFEHPLVAGPDLADVVGRGVGHAQEVGQESAVALDGEVALVALHGRNDHVPWKLEKALVEPAGEDGRVLDEERDLLQQLLVLDQAAAALIRRHAAQRLGDDVSSFPVVHKHQIVREDGLVVGRPFKRVGARRPEPESQR